MAETDIILSSDDKESLSINSFENFIIERLGWKFIRFPDKTEALDGLIVVRRNGRATGQMIWVQIKTGHSYRKPNKSIQDSFLLDLRSSQKLKRWRSYWYNVPGPVILVYAQKEVLNNSNYDFFWTDLKDNNSFSLKSKSCLNMSSNFYLDRSFGEQLKYLLDYRDINSYVNQIPSIQMTKDSFSYLSLSNSIKHDAWKYYKDWSKLDNVNPVFGKVHINRVGWQHITRPNRRRERILNSLQLLSVAKTIIKQVSHQKQIGGKSKAKYYPLSDSIKLKEYFYLKANVSFYHRGDTTVYVILRKITEVFNDSNKPSSVNTWFYSVYEGGRGIKGN